MKQNKYLIKLDQNEFDYIIHSLIEMKNQLIREGRYTDAVDDALIKLLKAKPTYL